MNEKHKSSASGFISEWISAIRGISDNPVAGWLLTARERKSVKHSLIRRLAIPILVCLLSTLTFFNSFLKNPQDQESLIELILTILTVGLIPAILIWTMQGLFQAVQDSFSLLSDDPDRSTGLRIDDQISVSGMSSAEISIGALQVIMPQMFWCSLAVSLCFWWIMLMVTSMFGADLRSESFIQTWTWGIITVPLMLLSSMLAACSVVFGCISAGLNSRGALLPLTSATLIMLCTLGWLIVGGSLLINDENVMMLTDSYSILGAVIFIGLSIVVALIARNSNLFRRGLAIFLPVLAFTSIFFLYRVVNTNGIEIGDIAEMVSIGLLRCWGSFSLLNPLFVPSSASWGDMFLHNPVSDTRDFARSLELRWLTGFVIQLVLVSITGWLAWVSITAKRTRN